MLKPRSEYKAQAKQRMQGKYVNVIVIYLIISFITGLFNAPSFNSAIGQNGNIGYNILSVITLVLAAGFAYATTNMFIKVSKDEQPDLQEILLSGFKNDFVRNLICHLLTLLFTFLWTLLFIIPGIIKAIAYSMNFYLMIKDPKLSGQDAITKSKEYTQGYKGDLFGLYLSYLGWFILSLFTFGILLLWVVPKLKTAQMLYFDEIYAAKNPAPKTV